MTRQELQNELIKRIDACYNEMIEDGEWLKSMVITARGQHISVGSHDQQADTKFNEIMHGLFDLAGEDHELVNFILSKAGEYGDNSALKKKREEIFGWEPGKICFSDDLDQERVDNFLEIISQYHCPNCSDEEE